jgi:hypothetical protein
VIDGVKRLTTTLKCHKTSQHSVEIKNWNLRSTHADSGGCALQRTHCRILPDDTQGSPVRIPLGAMNVCSLSLLLSCGREGIKMESAAEADHSPLTRGEVKNAWRHTAIPNTFIWSGA